MSALAQAFGFKHPGIADSDLPPDFDTPLSKAELGYSTQRKYRFTITLKSGLSDTREVEADRSIDAWLSLFAELDKRELEPMHISIKDLTGGFE